MKGARDGLESFAGGISVAINGIPSPLLYAGPEQINFQVPVEIAERAHRPCFPSATLPLLTESALDVRRVCSLGGWDKCSW
jgi:uncharacterized protein (TIGR03437 family)